MIICITNSKMNVLMNSERLDLYFALQRKGVLVITLKHNVSTIREILTLNCIDIDSLDGIIFEEAVWGKKLNFSTIFKDAASYRVPKATFITDYGLEIPYTREYIEKNDIDIVFTPHQTCISYIYDIHPSVKTVVHTPFCIVEEDYVQTVDKDIDILDTAQNHPLTPLRNKISKLASNIGNINYVKIPHPGKRKLDNNAIVGKRYMDYLHRSFFSIACTTTYRISVRKYWEIYASGGVVIGDRLQLPEHSLFKDNIVEISEAYSTKKIIYLIEMAIDRKKSMSTNSSNLKELIINYAGRNNVSGIIIDVMRSEECISISINKNSKFCKKIVNSNLPIHHDLHNKIDLMRSYMKSIVNNI